MSKKLVPVEPMNFNSVSFEIDKEKGLVNLTSIAKAFGKSINDWSKTKQTIELIEAYRVNNYDTNIFLTIKGGDNKEQGTWVCRELALDFCQWISIKFKVYCIKKLDELFQTGAATLKEMSPGEIMIANAQAFYKMEQAQAKLQAQITNNSEALERLSARVCTINEEYYTIAGYCSLQKYNVDNAEAIELGKKAARHSRDMNIKINKAHSTQHGTVNAYHKDILLSLFKIEGIVKQR